MISFLLGLTWGAIMGMVAKSLLKPVQIPKDKIDELVEEFRTEFRELLKPKQHGEFIEVNKVEQYLKENPGEISIGDIIDDSNE